MFSYLDIQFPTLDSNLHRAYEFSLTHARYEHELAKIYFLNWSVEYDSIASGTPVSVTVNGFNASRTMNGYVHHVQPDISPDKNYVEVSVIGASYSLKQQGQGVWVDSTADMVVADIAKKHGFSYIATPHPRVYDQILQAGMTDWELLVKLAKQCGYSFKADNTTLVFQPLTQDFTDMRQQANYYALGGLDKKSTGIFSFKPLIGEAIPFEDAQKSAVAIGGVDKSNANTFVNTNQKQIKTTRKTSKPAVFDRYLTNVVAPTFEIAKYESNAADERNRYAYRGEVVLPGNPKLLPDTPIFLDGVGNSYSGFWTILSVEQTVEEHMYTTTALVGTDSLGVSAQWTDNKAIDLPDDKVKRVVTPGLRQKNIQPKTVLNKNGKTNKQNNSSHFSAVKNQPKAKQSAPSYKWIGKSGNLKTPAVVDKKMPAFVLNKLGAQNVR